MRIAFSKILFILGLLCFILSGYLFWQRTTPRNLAFDLKDPLPIVFSNANLKPVRIQIKDLGINLHLYPAGMKNYRWESTTKGVSYLTSSPLPGEEGNSILYGHNWQNLLGNLRKAKPGQMIQIFFDNGTEKTFTIEGTATVSPSQTSVLDQTRDKRITLYTCTGFLDQKRFIAVAILSD